MKNTILFKQYVLDKNILVMPGAPDALTAKVIEKTGFRALVAGGYAISASYLGKPDVSLLTLTEMVNNVARISDAVKIPVFADADTGHGNTTNVIRTVKEMEKAGAAAMFLEDQLFPKMCGHMEGKQVIAVQDMIPKIKAAVDARMDQDFMIMARTDALAPLGIDEAIERANLYREAGADLIFVEAPKTIEEMIRITREVQAPTMANNVEGGKTPLLPAKQLEEIGYSIVAFPTAATYAITRAVGNLMGEILKEGTSEGFLDRMMTFEEFNTFIGLPEVRQTERKYYGGM